MSNTKQGKKGLIPELRFPEFNSEGEWEEKKMAEVYYFLVTNSFSRENLNYENGYVKNIHYGDIHTKFSTLFDITKESVPFINPDISIEKIREECYCQEGDIVFADASEDLNDIGKSIEIINLNGEKLLAGLHTLLARQIRGILVIGFGGYLFKTDWIRTQIQRESQGAKVLGISVGRISTIKIFYPRRPEEQQKIVSCLSSLDELITTHAEKLEALQAHKKGLLQNLFPQEGQVAPNYRFPEFEDDKEWELTALKELGELVNGLTYSPKDVRDDGLLVLRSSNIQDGIIDYEDCVYVRSDIKGANIILPRDILVCVRNGSKRLIGKNAIIPEDIPKATHGAFMTVFRAKNPEFIFQLFQSGSYERQVKADLGATINSINGKNFLKYEFSIPKNPKEQEKIASCLSEVDELIRFQAEKIGQFQQHKKGLMQRLFPQIKD